MEGCILVGQWAVTVCCLLLIMYLTVSTCPGSDDWHYPLLLGQWFWLGMRAYAAHVCVVDSMSHSMFIVDAICFISTSIFCT